jgi:hypothetical protein
MATNFQPYGFIENPGLHSLYLQAKNDTIENGCRRLTHFLLTGLVGKHGGYFTGENHAVNDMTLTESDNLVYFYQKSTWQLRILVIGEGKVSGDGHKWSVAKAKEAEHQLLGYCIEYCHMKDKNEFPFVWGLTWVHTHWRFWRYVHGARVLEGLDNTPDSRIAGGEKYYHDVGDNAGAVIIRRHSDMICMNTPQSRVLLDHPKQQPQQSSPYQQQPQQPSPYQQQPQYKVSYQLPTQQTGGPAQHATQPSGQLHATLQAAGAGGNNDDDDEEEEEEEEEEHVQQETYASVKLTLTRHRFSENEYMFKDAKGISRSTRSNEWKKVATTDGSPAWVYQGRRTKYITYKMPS